MSLVESIDTSSPAGCLFYIMIAAMALGEERDKKGKALGGRASFGWKDGKLEPHPAETRVASLSTSFSGSIAAKRPWPGFSMSEGTEPGTGRFSL